MSSTPLLTQREVAERLHTTARGSVNRIHRGEDHPPVIQVDKHRYYPINEFERWLRSRLVRAVCGEVQR